MKKKIAILLVLSILILSGCQKAQQAGEFITKETSPPAAYQPDSAIENSEYSYSNPISNTSNAESVSQTEVNNPNENTNDQSDTSETEPEIPSEPPVTMPSETQPHETEPHVTAPQETEPPETQPSAVATTQQEVTETETNPSQPDATEPPDDTEEITDSLDCNEAMERGNAYGTSTYGWTVDMSLNENNSGFHFGSWVFASEGQDQLNYAAYRQVDFLYQEMQSRYPGLDLSSIRFRVHAFECGDGLYEVRVYYA